MELIKLVDEADGDLACISVVAPSTVIHARYLCAKLRAQLPNLKIVVGLWGATENIIQAAQRLRDSGASEVVTTLADAVVQLAKLAPADKDPGLFSPRRAKTSRFRYSVGPRKPILQESGRNCPKI